MCSTYSQIIEATGEAYGLTQSSYALPAWRHMKKEFPHTVSYNRFVERQAQVALHLLVINDKGEIIQWQLTPGNVDDRAPLKDSRFTEKLFGKLFADRGYISQDLFEMLFVDDIHLVTKIKKNMKNSLMNLYDKLMLRKRSVIETVNDELKNVCQIEHTRHRSIDNFATNLFAGLIAYNLLPKKPAMNLEIIDRSRLIA